MMTAFLLVVCAVFLLVSTNAALSTPVNGYTLVALIVSTLAFIVGLIMNDIPSATFVLVLGYTLAWFVEVAHHTSAPQFAPAWKTIDGTATTVTK